MPSYASHVPTTSLLTLVFFISFDPLIDCASSCRFDDCRAKNSSLCMDAWIWMVVFPERPPLPSRTSRLSLIRSFGFVFGTRGRTNSQLSRTLFSLEAQLRFFINVQARGRGNLWVAFIYSLTCFYPCVLICMYVCMYVCMCTLCVGL